MVCLCVSSVMALLGVFSARDDATNPSMLLPSKLLDSCISSSSSSNNNNDDQGCPFRDSFLYRSIFVYPNPHTEADMFAKFRPSNNASADDTIVGWPWIQNLLRHRTNGQGLYDIDNPSLTQFTLDVIVYEIMTSAHSCLRTWDPTHAKLFFVPFLPRLYRRSGGTDTGGGEDDAKTEHTSAYEEALAQAVMGTSYDGWEQMFGLTSQFWKLKQGTDHVVVMPEPLHGLYHPRGKRGFHHYIKTQKQLWAPIVISVELSKTFVETYPSCSQKNIVVPYPNIDGRWYNGRWDEQTMKYKRTYQRERQSTIDSQNKNQQLDQLTGEVIGKDSRPFSVYYAAGNHGECLSLRTSLRTNHQCGNPSVIKWLALNSENISFPVGMRMVTFCPCPAGDSPSAKRMYDAVLAGCIPVVLSHNFLWPFSTDLSIKAGRPSSVTTNPQYPVLKPETFAIHLDAQSFSHAIYQQTRATNGSLICHLLDDAQDNQHQQPQSLQTYLLRSFTQEKVSSLQKGLVEATYALSYFASSSRDQDEESLPDSPLQRGILPSGAATHRLLGELAHRARHGKENWDKCQEEKTNILSRTGGKMVTRNKC